MTNDDSRTEVGIINLTLPTTYFKSKGFENVYTYLSHGHIYTYSQVCGRLLISCTRSIYFIDGTWKISLFGKFFEFFSSQKLYYVVDEAVTVKLGIYQFLSRL